MSQVRNADKDFKGRDLKIYLLSNSRIVHGGHKIRFLERPNLHQSFELEHLMRARGDLMGGGRRSKRYKFRIGKTF